MPRLSSSRSSADFPKNNMVTFLLIGIGCQLSTPTVYLDAKYEFFTKTKHKANGRPGAV